MNLLLDTHTVIWLVMEPNSLPRRVRDALVADENRCFVSIVSLWEMTIKSSKGSLELPGLNILTMIQALHDYCYEILDVKAADMAYLQALPRLHKDPFDRMIVCQASRHGMTLITVDGVLADYGVSVLWE